MKKILAILVLGFLTINIVYAENRASKDWFVYETSGQRVWIYDIKNVEEIGLSQFKILKIRSKTKEKLKYQELIVDEISKFCEKPKGVYTTPKAILKYGAPDVEDFGVEVSIIKESKYIKYQIAYKKFLEEHEYNKKKYRGDMEISCNLKDERSDGSLVDMKLKDIVQFYKELVYKEYKAVEYFDCRREMKGRFYRKIGDKNKKIHWRPPNEGSLGEFILNEVCSRLET